MNAGAPSAPRASRARGALSLCLLACACAAPADFEPSPELSLDVGGAIAQDSEALLGGLGLAFPVAEHWTLGLRVTAYDFELKESGTLEVDGFVLDASQTTTGQGLGGGPELRFYPRRALDGFWLGLGLLYFPFTDFESVGEARERTSGMVFTQELEPDEIDFVPYGALGWTLRTGGPFSIGLHLSAGTAAGEAFGTLGVQLGFAL
jgi:hypothetical protein